MSKKKMPTKKSTYEDDFESEEMSELETLVSKPSLKVNRAASKTKKTSMKKPATMSRRVQSAPGMRPARELWLASVKARTTGSPRNATMSGLTQKDKSGWGFLSSSNYMRQLGAGDRAKKPSEEQTLRQTAGTPAYKSQEEYYDDIIQLKKTIQASNQEISNMRSKLRRTEEDNLKKEKEIEQLLDPTKSEELRRTLTDRKADAGAVIHSLKQKVLKLEVQLRDKEAANAKLLADLKTTKVDEMKTQMEVLYREIVRLQHTKDVSSHDTPANVTKESGSKLKALNETVLRLNDQTQRLQRDNKKLKEDLQKAVEETASVDSLAKHQNIQNLGKNELISMVRRLNRRVDKAEQRADMDSVSLMSADVKPSDSSSKIVLEGTVENRLDQLDQRETELLQETDKLRAMMKRLKDDRTFYRQAAEEKDIEIKVLKNAMEGLPPPASGRSSARDRVSAKDRKDVTPRKTSTRPLSARSETSRKRRDSTSNEEERHRALDKFKKNRAAKNIQKKWREHQEHVKVDEATSTIQAAILGHRTRKTRLHDWRDDSCVAASDVTDDEYNQAVDLIQSSLSGHTARRKRLSNPRMESTTDEEIDIVRKKPPRHSMTPESRTSSRTNTSGRQYTRRATVERDFYDDDDDGF